MFNQTEKTVLILLIAILFVLAGVRYIQDKSKQVTVSVEHSGPRPEGQVR